MDHNQQIETDRPDCHRSAGVAKDDQVRLARQIAAAARREGPRVHPLATLWPTIAEILALNHSLRYAVRKLKAEGFDLSLSQAVRYRKKLGQPGYPDAAPPQHAARLQSDAPLALPKVTRSPGSTSANPPQGLEPIESEVFARLTEMEKAKYWTMGATAQKLFIRKAFEKMKGE